MRTPPHVAVLLGFALTTTAAARDKQTLEEPASDSRVFSVEQSMSLTGTLTAPRPKAKPLLLKMNAAAKHAFLERQLPGRGRELLALRALREYRSATTEIAIGSSRRSKKLGRDVRRIVMQGDAAGLVPWSPKQPLSFSDVELLKMPGDVLAARAFLPPLAVGVGETWSPNTWAVELLTGLDAVAKSDAECKLESVRGTTAVVSFRGKVEGARDGAATKLEISGEYRFDLKKNYLTSFTLTQKEKSSAGPVSPALDVVAKVRVRREVASDAGPLTEAAVKRIPLEPDGRLLGAVFSPAIGVKFLLPRNWHIFYDGSEMAILRLLDRGNLIAQVNIKPLKKAEPGKHVAEREFQQEIRDSLGSQLTSITTAEQVQAKEAGDKRFLYRVVADGSSNGVDMRWIYCLCASPEGRQISLMFAVEKKLLKQFGDRDVGVLLSAEFPDEK